jgi:hypothetical protein
LALRIGCLGPLPDAAEPAVDCLGAILDGPLLDLVVDGFGRLLAVRGTLNDQLRTGTDKGNLTV